MTRFSGNALGSIHLPGDFVLPSFQRRVRHRSARFIAEAAYEDRPDLILVAAGIVLRPP
jgi:hypothetical protein